MQKDPQYYETIHQYLNGLLEGDALKNFEAALTNEPGLKEDVEWERKLLLGIEAEGDARLRETVRKTHAHLKTKGFFDQKPANESNTLSTAKPIINMKSISRTLAIAASVVIVLVAGYFLINKPGNEDIQKEAFTKYYHPESVNVKRIIDGLSSFGMVSGEKTDKDSLKDALQLYADGQYDAAIESLNAILNIHPEDNTAKMYLGLSLLNQSQYGKAVRILEPLSRLDSFELKEDARWYLAICYLTTETNQDDALKIFETMASTESSPYRKDAKGMVNLIKR